MAHTEVSIKQNLTVCSGFSQKAFDRIVQYYCYRPLGVRFPTLHFFPLAILASFLSIQWFIYLDAWPLLGYESYDCFATRVICLGRARKRAVRGPPGSENLENTL